MKKEPTEEELKQIEINYQDQLKMFEHFDEVINDMEEYEDEE